MLLYRRCSINEVAKIMENGSDKLQVGAPLFNYTTRDVNLYPIYKRLQRDIALAKDFNSKIELIKKVFPCLPDEIPIIEKDYKKRLELEKKFVGEGWFKQIYRPKFIKEHDDTYLYTIQCVAFFDTINKFVKFTNEECIMAIEIDDAIAEKYKGYGNYGRQIPEYAIPTYFLSEKNIRFVDFLHYRSARAEAVHEYFKNKYTEEEYQKLREEVKKNSQERCDSICNYKNPEYDERITYYFSEIYPSVHKFAATIRCDGLQPEYVEDEDEEYYYEVIIPEVDYNAYNDHIQEIYGSEEKD